MYFYFLCAGRQRRTCDLPYLPVGQVETAVAAHHTTIILPDERRRHFLHRLERAHPGVAATAGDLRRHVVTRLSTLDADEDRLLDLLGDHDWPRDKIATRLRALRDERDRLHRRLDAPPDPAPARPGTSLLPDLLADLGALYRRVGENARRALNRAIFAKLLLDHDGDAIYVGADHPAP